MAGKMRKGCLVGLGLTGLALVGLGAFYGPTLYDIWNAGFLEQQPKRTWTADTEANLKVLHTALKLHNDSEGQLPKSDRWMDDAIRRVRTEDMKKAEVEKKFVDPAAGGGEGIWGFAMNEKASETYLDDVPDPDATPLLFQSTDTSWNAHGDPAKIGREGGVGITPSGKIVKL